MKPGETPEQSISRLVKRELHLLVEPSRFQQLGTHSYVWARRQQPPMDNGTCDISVVLTLVLLPGEADCIFMDEKEYSEFRCVLNPKPLMNLSSDTIDLQFFSIVWK